MPREPVPTYDEFELHTLTIVTGWQSVYHDKEGHHFCAPVHALALATRHTLEVRTNRPRLFPGENPAFHREVVALSYSPVDGWDICETSKNYCGVLPPHMILADFEAADGCGHSRPDATEKG